MNILESARIALRGLRANRLRSALTTLGIIIGVSAVIVLTALGNGIQTGVTGQFSSFTTQITVTPEPRRGHRRTRRPRPHRRRRRRVAQQVEGTRTSSRPARW